MKCKMRSIFVVVADAFEAFQMPFIHHDDVVKEIPAAVANPTLGNTTLPWTSKTGPLWLDAKTLHCEDGFLIEARDAIEDQVAGCRVIRKRVAQLADPDIAQRGEKAVLLRLTLLRSLRRIASKPISAGRSAGRCAGRCGRVLGEPILSWCCHHFTTFAPSLV